jgi:hypothetical protein
MRSNFWRILILSVWLGFNWLHAQAPLSMDAVVRIDGKIISADSTLTFNRDDTVYLEATGIKPNSTITFKVKKMGIRWFEDAYEVDETGEVKGVMQIPEEKITVNCTVSYYSADEDFHEVEFKFKTI